MSRVPIPSQALTRNRAAMDSRVPTRSQVAMANQAVTGNKVVMANKAVTSSNSSSHLNSHLLQAIHHLHHLMAASHPASMGSRAVAIASKVIIVKTTKITKVLMGRNPTKVIPVLKAATLEVRIPVVGAAACMTEVA